MITNSLKHKSNPSVSFWNKDEGRFQNNIWQELNSGMWKEFSCDTWLSNELLPAQQLASQKALFPKYQQIVPGTKWNINKQCLELELYKPNFRECTLNHFLDLASEYFRNLNATKIGIHLSGGLDSSIIMCILKELKIPFVPIGFKSKAFEFRTERRVQEILLEYGVDGLLIDIDDCPFYSKLLDLPKHQIPMDNIKSNASASSMAVAFAERGCDVIFTGQGADSLFVDSIINIDSLSFNIGNEFENPIEQELYYGPHKLSLIPFFAYPPFIDALSTAAIGRHVDPLKKWARKWFAPILPKELVEYTYCADFFGLSLGSLEIAKPTVKLLFEEAYDLSQNQYFSSKNTKQFINQDVFSFEYKDYIRFCSLIAVAVWYHSLMKN